MRRQTIGLRVAASTVMILSVIPLTAKGQTAATDFPVYNPSRHLLVDDEQIADMRGCTRNVGRPYIHPEPVLVADQPWEIDRSTCAYVNSAMYDPEKKRFRLWYTAIDFRGWEKDRTKVGNFLCYAESEDGIHWTKPNLGITEYHGSKDNNIVFNCSDLGVGASSSAGISYFVGQIVIDPNEKNPEHRYKMLGFSHGPPGGLWMATSPDGLHWHTPIKHIRGSGDRMCVIRDEARKVWVLTDHGSQGWTADESKEADRYWKEYLGTGVGHTRNACIYESDDLVNWRSIGPSLKLDEQDGYGVFYQQWSVCPFASGNQWVGLANYVPMYGGVARLLVISSRDGRNFQHVARDQPFITAGAKGTWIGQLVCQTLNAPLAVGDNWYIIFTARDHSRERDNYGKPIRNPDMRTGVAIVKPERLAGISGGFLYKDGHGKGGYVVTKPLKVTGPKLTLNYWGGQGNVRVEVQDAEGKPIPQYVEADAIPMNGEALRAPARWKAEADLTELVGKEVRLKFRLWGCTLYSYGFEE